MLRGGKKCFDGAAHGQKARPVDIDPVDLLDLGESDRPRHGAALDLDCELVPGPRIELLRIVDAWNPRSWLEYDCSSGDRPCERTHAGFIDAGNVQHAGGPKRGLELQQLAQSLPLRAVFARRRAMASRMDRAPGRGSARNAASVSASSLRASMT